MLYSKIIRKRNEVVIMQWIYYGLKESTLIQAFLLFWSLYGIYVAIMKNNSFNKKTPLYKFLNKKVSYRTF